MSIFMCLMSNVTRVYFSVSCTQCCPYLSVCVLCPMLPVSIFLCLLPNVAVSIFLCLVPNVAYVYLSVSFTQCCPCIAFCALCPMLPVSIFLCLVPNVARVYFLLPLSVSSNVYGLIFIDQSVIEYKTWILIKFLWHGHVYRVINIVIINFATGTYWCRGCM